MFGADRLVIDQAIPDLVERAFGRIKIIDGGVKTVLDEPLVLKTAENFFKKQDPDFMAALETWAKMSNSA
jgi:hypothetical protein